MWIHRKKPQWRLSCEWQQFPSLQAITFSDQQLEQRPSRASQREQLGWDPSVSLREASQIVCWSLCLIFISRRKHKVQVTQGQGWRRVGLGERQRTLPPKPALTGPTTEVSSPNESQLFTYTTSSDVVPPGLAQLHSLSTGSWASG